MTEGPYIYAQEVREVLRLASAGAGIDELPRQLSTPEVRHFHAMAFEAELRKLTRVGDHHLAARRLLDCMPWLLEDVDGRGSLELRPAKDLATCAGCGRVTEPFKMKPSTVFERVLPEGWLQVGPEVLCPACRQPGSDPRARHRELEG